MSGRGVPRKGQAPAAYISVLGVGRAPVVHPRQKGGAAVGRRRRGRNLQRGRSGEGEEGQEHRRSSLRQRLARSLEIPQDVVMDLPRVTVLGDLQATIENHRGVIQYGPERVLVGMNKGRILITGQELVIGVVHAEEITVTGLLDSIVFQRLG